MKRIALTFCVLFSCPSLAMADDLAMASTMSETPHAILGGVVKSVSLANPAIGTKSEIVVKDISGKLTSILVTATTTLWDGDTKAIMLDKISVQNHVNVIYITSPEGLNLGKSIRIVT